MNSKESIRKKILSIVLMLFVITYSCAQQKNKIGMVEQFNFDLVQGQKNNVSIKQEDGWVKLLPIHGRYIQEYSPAKDFYMISKEFHTNGIIKSRGKKLGRVKFGIWEYFDENGKLTSAIDEDTKFGKIKPHDIVEILERKEVINRKEGTSITHRDKRYGNSGEFYQNVINSINITFEPALLDGDKNETVPPKWRVYYPKGGSSTYYYCNVNGNTGEWTEDKGTVIKNY